MCQDVFVYILSALNPLATMILEKNIRGPKSIFKKIHKSRVVN